jgi:ATP-dependent DNA ligase
MADYRSAGIEGLVVKAAAGVYVPGRRDWIKVKSRETVEVILGAVTGPINRPDTVVVGLVRDGVLTIVGKSVPLSRAQAASLAAVLSPAGPDHPWPDEISSSRFGSSKSKVALTKVDPVVVAEVSADSALQAGAFRHPVRFVRHRPELSVEDLSDRP